MAPQSSQPPVVLVTGASGYIAMHIVQQLLKIRRYRVRGTVRDLSNASKVDPLMALDTNDKSPRLEVVQAELLDGPSWVAAAAGCTYVIHSACPFPNQDEHEDKAINLAVEGTLNVLKACRVVSSVRRVVLTSSIAAVSALLDDDRNKLVTENDWATAAHLTSYAKSKLQAEVKAWQYVENLTPKQRFQLTVINPSFVMGPVLSGNVSSTSMLVPKRLLERQMPLVPHINIPVVDVRDVAAAHIKAMTVRKAAGQRHLVHGSNIWLEEISDILAAEFGRYGYKVPTKNAPYPIMWLVSIFDKTLRPILPMYGKETHIDNSRMKNVLGVQPTDIKSTMIDMAYSMIDMGIIYRAPQYTGRLTRIPSVYVT